MTQDAAWRSLIPGDPAAVSFPSVKEAASRADAIVIGAVTGVAKGPQFVDEYGNTIYLITYSVAFERVLKGAPRTPRPGTVMLRNWLGGEPPGSAASYEAEYARIAAELPKGRALLFLENLAKRTVRRGGPVDHPAADPLAYTLIGGQGYLREVDGVVQPPLLTSDELDAMAGTWQEDLRGADFDDVVAEIAALP